MTIAVGSRVSLRRARLLDRPRIHEWLTQSDLTPNTLGAPLYPDLEPPTLEEFSAEYVNSYFDGTRPYAGRMFVIGLGGDEVGAVSHGSIDLGNDVVELDIWLAERRLASRGLGSEALVLLADWL
ncbi:MAG: GNAT family N-acetyltransferase, partial [Burkholderiaceae bacterium]